MQLWTATSLRRLRAQAFQLRCRRNASKSTAGNVQKPPIIPSTLGLHDDVEEGKPEAVPQYERGEHKAEGDDYVDLKPEDVVPPHKGAYTTSAGEGIRTHRVRTHGNKALPLSPIIDPIFVAARSRWKGTKPPPPKMDELTAFQEKLHSNPYAHMLATPVREAVNSQSHLPRSFLLPLSLMRTPSDPDKHVLLPARLWARSNSYHDYLKNASGPQSHVDLSLSALEVLQRSKTMAATWFKDTAAFSGLVNRRSFQRVQVETRADLGEMVLKLLRQQAIKLLAWAFKHPNTRLVCRYNGDFTSFPDDAAALLLLESQEAAQCLVNKPLNPWHPQRLGFDSDTPPQSLSALVQRAMATVRGCSSTARNEQLSRTKLIGKGRRTEKGVPLADTPSPMPNVESLYPVATYAYPVFTDSEERKVPVLRFAQLLGIESLSDLIRGTAYESALYDKGQRTWLTLSKDNRNLKAHMALLQLQNFLATPWGDEMVFMSKEKREQLRQEKSMQATEAIRTA